MGERLSRAEVFTDTAGEFRFRLVARNGETVAASEGYRRLQDAINGIEIVTGATYNPSGDGSAKFSRGGESFRLSRVTP